MYQANRCVDEKFYDIATGLQIDSILYLMKYLCSICCGFEVCGEERGGAGITRICNGDPSRQSSGKSMLIRLALNNAVFWRVKCLFAVCITIYYQVDNDNLYCSTVICGFNIILCFYLRNKKSRFNIQYF